MRLAALIFPLLPLWTSSLGLSPTAGTAPAPAPAPVNIVVVREHGVGSAAQAQGYLDKLVAVAAKINDWTAAEGKYLTDRTRAQAYFDEAKPKFGILSLASFLALREAYRLEVLGKADAKGAGGGKYYVVGKGKKSLDECKGKPLASDHLDDKRFLEKVVVRGDFSLDAFELMPTKRPVQTIKAVTRGEATCALIDDAQFADLRNIEGGSELQQVWHSSELPPMVVVAFPAAGQDAKRFKTRLPQVCMGAGQSACADVGIKMLMPATELEYRKVIALY